MQQAAKTPCAGRRECDAPEVNEKLVLVFSNTASAAAGAVNLPASRAPLQGPRTEYKPGESPRIARAPQGPLMRARTYGFATCQPGTEPPFASPAFLSCFQV